MKSHGKTLIARRLWKVGCKRGADMINRDILDVDLDELTAEEMSVYKAELTEYIDSLSREEQTEEVAELLAEAEDTLLYIETAFGE